MMFLLELFVEAGWLFFLVINHPVHPELVSKHSKIVTPGSFAHGNGNCTACGKVIKEFICQFIAIGMKRQ
jgi:hypothetical protein